MDDRYRALLAQSFPDLPVRSFAYLGAGEDHIAFAVDETLIVRFNKADDRAALAREVRVLRYVATLTELAVPHPAYVAHDAGFLGYPKLPGTPLLAARGAFELRRWPDFARQIGGFLRAINDAPVAPLAEVLAAEIVSPEELLTEARASFAEVRQRIPRPFWASIQAFLDAVPEEHSFTPVLAHNDLGIEHILVDVAARRVTGIIDWGDAALADPAYDLGKLYRDLGPAVLDALLDAYDVGSARAALRRRAIFYARCGVLEELAFGLDTGRDEYSTKSLAALPWLFP